jgi:hypothetical protein
MAEDVAHFAVHSVGLSKSGKKKPCTTENAARHNLREIQAELGASGHIDPRRMADNVILAGPATAKAVQALANELLSKVDTSKLKRDHVQAIEAVFSLPPRTAIEPMLYFESCLKWLRIALPLPVLLATAHHDEAAPHMHVLMLPVKDGKHIGGALIDLASLRNLRESFFQNVAGPAGLKRDGAKVRGKVKRWVVDAVLARCKDMTLPVAMGALWPIWVAAIERDPTAAMLALDIDVNTVRPVDKDQPESPIALAQSPIALHDKDSKTQGLSCVALLSQTTIRTATKATPEASQAPADTPPAIDTMSALWAAVGCRSSWVKPTDAERERLHQLAKNRAAKVSQTRTERMQAAKVAEQRAIDRHQKPAPATTRTLSRVREDDGITRERDPAFMELLAHGW